MRKKYGAVWWGKPKVSTPTHGCFMFEFSEAKDVPRFLRRNCSINSTMVLQKQWHPLSDASQENIDLAPVFVRMPRLLPQCWTIDVFKSIGNILGTFMDTNLSF